MTNASLYQATGVAVAVDPDGPVHAILLRGASGVGKSSVALDLIAHCPWRRSYLIGDDGVEIVRRGGRLVASSPPHIAGLIELYGFGPTRIRTGPPAAVTAVFDIGEAPERLPAMQEAVIAECSLPLWPMRHTAQSAARLRLVLRAIIAGQMP